MNDIRINLPSLALLLAVVGAGAFAAGSAVPSSSAASSPPRPVAEPALQEEPEPQQLPPGHPPVDDPSTRQGGAEDNTENKPSEDEVTLDWKAPARWQLVPNASTMRIATYRVPHAPGDATDAELSISRAGGSADANIERWIHQFDEAGQKTARRSTRAIGLADVAIVEVQGTYAGGMGNGAAPQMPQEPREPRNGWALIGAVVSVPGTPYFFKLTGPAKSVLAARGELDALLGSLTRHRDPRNP
jgi:hypothetical protein